MFKKNFCSEKQKMEPMPIIKLPFWETLRRSFLYAFVNLDAFIRIASFWFLILIYEVLTGYPSLCSLEDGTCSDDWRQNVSVIALSLASIAISVAYCRHVISRRNYKYFSFSFGRRELKYLGYSLLLILIIGIPSVIITFVLAYTFSALGLPQSFLKIMIFIPFIVAVICSRFFIILPAIAVGNRKLTLKKAFALTKGNANKIFWGQVLMMIPVVLGLIILSVLYGYFGTENGLLNFVFVTILMGLSFFDTCLKCSFYSHVYQYFMYFYNKYRKETEE